MGTSAQGSGLVGRRPHVGLARGAEHVGLDAISAFTAVDRHIAAAGAFVEARQFVAASQELAEARASGYTPLDGSRVGISDRLPLR